MIPFGPSAPRQDVVLVHAGEITDSYGDVVESWAEEDVIRTPLPGAFVQYRSSTETASSGRVAVTVDALLIAPGDPGLHEADRVEVDGETWRVDGRPALRRGFGGAHLHTAASLTRVTG